MHDIQKYVATTIFNLFIASLITSDDDRSLFLSYHSLTITVSFPASVILRIFRY